MNKKMILNFVKDLTSSIKSSQYLFHSALLEVKYKYKRSILGPLWIMLTTAIFITVISLVYKQLFNIEIANLLPYLSLGYILWILFSSIILESINILNENRAIINDMKINYFDLIIKNIFKNFILFFHNFILVAIIFLYLKITPTVFIFFGFLNLFICGFSMIFISYFISIFTLRYKDIGQFLSSIMFLFFLITPIFWEAKLLGNSNLLLYNYFYYLIDFVRQPILGNNLELSFYMIIFTANLFFILLSFFAYNFKKKVIFWF